MPNMAVVAGNQALTQTRQSLSTETRCTAAEVAQAGARAARFLPPVAVEVRRLRRQRAGWLETILPIYPTAVQAAMVGTLRLELVELADFLAAVAAVEARLQAHKPAVVVATAVSS